MPAKDLYHNVVKNALIKDGWRITHDPLRLKWGIKDMYVRSEPDRKLYLAITQSVFSELLSEPLGQIIRADYQVCLIVFAEKNEEIVQWEP